MAYEISILVRNLQIQEMLGDVKVKVKDLRPFFRRELKELQEQLERQFATEGRDGGSAWASLSPTYAAWKAERYPGKGILRRTDRLYNSLTGKTSDTHVIVNRKSLKLRSSVPYAIYHQQGTSTMPARPITVFNNRTQTNFRDRLLDHLERILP